MTENQQKAKKLLKRLQELKDPTLKGRIKRLLNEEAENASQNAKESPVSRAIQELAKEVEGVKGEPKARKILDTVAKAERQNRKELTDLTKDFGEKAETLMGRIMEAEGRGTKFTTQEMNRVLGELKQHKQTFDTEKQRIDSSAALLQGEISRIRQEFSRMFEGVKSDISGYSFRAETVETSIKEVDEKLDKLATELRSRIASTQHGGGNMNRSIVVGGNQSTLGYYTDLNLKAGANTTITYTPNHATKFTDITFANTGGSGSTRSVNSISTNTAAGSSAGTDYVYICTGTITVTLPATVGNSNLYTIKNAGTGVVSIATTGGNTIDAQPSIQLGTQYTSVDLISDGVSNWNIT